MRGRFRCRLGLVPLCATAVVLPAFAATADGSPPPGVPSPSPLCLTIDPVLALGCKGPTATSTPGPQAAGGPGSTSTPEAGAVANSASVALSPTSIEYDPKRIALMVERRASMRSVLLAFARARVQLERAIPAIRSYLVRVAPDRQSAALRILRASPVIARAGPDVISHVLDTTPDDSDWPLQVGLRVVGFPRAWDTTRGSSRITVAVVDTGVDPSQPDLRGALVAGTNFVDPAAPPRDDHGHGTAVAGIIGARSNNKQGMTGICWLCSLMPVKVLDKSGSGDDTQIAAGIVWAADHGAQVINLSLGGPGTTPELAAALTYAANRGAIVVAAAGNSGSTVPFYPAADTNALSVAATTTSDQVYSWSNYGSWVKVAAPGCNVAPLLSGGYGTFCGTSSATPIVAGLAALALSTQPTASATEVEQAIEQTATVLPGVVHYGRVNAAETLGALTHAPLRVELVRSGTLTAAHETRTYQFQAAPGPFTATVRFPQGRLLTLTLVSLETRTQLARVTGPSPLRLSQTVTGPVQLRIHAGGGRPTRFVFTASFSR